jgi:8-oxo-dGTP pyrophosphatase MutT (NUDIX family)
MTPPSIERTERLVLATMSAPWPFAVTQKSAIDAHWLRRSGENPAFFNGQVYMMRGLERIAEGYLAHFSQQAFAEYLYWRETGLSDDGVRDGFGSALVRSREGHILLGRQAAGRLNAGQIYLPGGFLDVRDLRPDGTLDLDASVARELAEETSLDAGILQRVPGYYVLRYGHRCSFVIEYRAPLDAATLRARMLDGIKRDQEGELVDIIIVDRASEIDHLPILEHARFLLHHVLGARHDAPL